MLLYVFIHASLEQNFFIFFHKIFDILFLRVLYH